MARALRMVVLSAVGLAVLASVAAGTAQASDSLSGIYDGQSTLVSFTPPPAGPIDPGTAADRPKSPAAGSVILDCTKGRVCSTFYPPYGAVSLTPVATGHYRGRGVYPSGCKWNSPQPVGDFDIRVSGDQLTETVITKAGIFTDHCPGQQGSDQIYMAGAHWDFRGTRRGAPTTAGSGKTPGGTSTGTSGKSATGAAGTSSVAKREAAMSSRQLDNLAAVTAGRLSSVPGSLQSPSEAFKNAGHIAQNLALAAILVLLLVFPSQLFNSTFDKHHERIQAPWRKRFGRSKKAASSANDASSARRAAVYGGVVLVGAVLAGFLDPHFGFKTASYALLIGVIASTLFGAASGGLINRGYRRARDFSASAILVAVPAGLAIAFACVVVSRSVHFQPGYLYGLVGGISFVVALDKREAGRAHFFVFFIGLIVAIVGWLLFVPVSQAANGAHPGLGVLAVDAFLSAVFIGGIEGALFTLVPLRFLPGHDVARWSWIGWGLLAFATSFLFVDVLLRPETGYLGQSSSASAFVTYGLFAIFGLTSIAFWGWFRTHPDPIPVPGGVDPFSP